MSSSPSCRASSRSRADGRHRSRRRRCRRPVPAAALHADRRDQRHAAGRRHAGAADHLHGHRAAVARSACRSTCPRPARSRSAARTSRWSSSVNAKDEVFLGETKFELAELSAKLKAVHEEKPDQRVFIRGDKAINYGRMMEVMGVVIDSGFRQLGLLGEQGASGAGGRGASPAAPARLRRPRRGGEAWPAAFRPASRCARRQCCRRRVHRRGAGGGDRELQFLQHAADGARAGDGRFRGDRRPRRPPPRSASRSSSPRRPRSPRKPARRRRRRRPSRRRRRPRRRPRRPSPTSPRPSPFRRCRWRSRSPSRPSRWKTDRDEAEGAGAAEGGEEAEPPKPEPPKPEVKKPEPAPPRPDAEPPKPPPAKPVPKKDPVDSLLDDILKNNDRTRRSRRRSSRRSGRRRSRARRRWRPVRRRS